MLGTKTFARADAMWSSSVRSRENIPWSRGVGATGSARGTASSTAMAVNTELQVEHRTDLSTRSAGTIRRDWQVGQMTCTDIETSGWGLTLSRRHPTLPPAWGPVS